MFRPVATIFFCTVWLVSAALAESVVHRGNRGEPDTLDPHKTANGWEASIATEIFMGLTAAGPRGQVLPGIAESWVISEDGRTYRWTLREGLVWSDGEALTAADVVYSYRRLLDPVTASPFASLLYPIKNAEAVNTSQIRPAALGVSARDDLTVIMELEHAAPYFPQLLMHRGLPVPRHVVERVGTRWARPATFVGNGVFTLDEWVPQSHVRLNKNPRFFDSNSVALDALYFHPSENLSAALNQFRAGSLDVVPSLPQDRVAWAQENTPDALRMHPSLGVEFLVFNTTRPPFDDVRLRQALSMAIDRSVLANNFLKGGELPAYSIVHPDVMGDQGEYQPSFLAQDRAERLKRAEELLRDAGYDRANPLKVTARFNNQDIVAATMGVVARMWSRLPVDVELLGSDTPTLYADTRSGNFDVARAAWYPEAVDPSAYLYLLKSTSGPMNQSSYSNPDFDALLDQADREVDPQRRLEIYRQAEGLIEEEQPLAPLFYYAYRMLVSPKIIGWENYNRNLHPGRFLSIRD